MRISKALLHRSMQRWYINSSAYAAPLYMSRNSVSLWVGPSTRSQIKRLWILIASKSSPMFCKSSSVLNSLANPKAALCGISGRFGSGFPPVPCKCLRLVAICQCSKASCKTVTNCYIYELLSYEYRPRLYKYRSLFLVCSQCSIKLLFCYVTLICCNLLIWIIGEFDKMVFIVFHLSLNKMHPDIFIWMTKSIIKVL